MRFKKETMTVLTIFVAIVLLVSAPLLSQKKPARFYPDFMKQKENIKNICLIGDFLHLQDIKGKIDVFEYGRNQFLWEMFAEYFKPMLEKKNYHLNQIHLTSMGLYLDPEVKMFVEKTEEDEQKKRRDLPKGSAPFFINEKVEQDPAYKKNLEALYKKLEEYEKKPGIPNIKVPEAQDLVEGTDCDTLFVVTMLGRSVSKVQLIAGAVVGGLIGQAIMGFTKGIFYGLYIIDVKSGELIWTHKHHNSNWAIITRAAMKRIARYFSKNLPYKMDLSLSKKAEEAEQEVQTEPEPLVEGEEVITKREGVKAETKKKKVGIALKCGMAFTSQNYSFDNSYDQLDNKTKSGFQVGLSFDLKFSNNVSFRPEILYVSRGTKFEETYGSYKDQFFFKLNYIEVPLLFSYSFSGGKNLTPGLFIGPYLAINTAAREVEKWIDLDDDETDIMEEKSEMFKALDYGLSIGGFLDFNLKAIKLILDIRYNLGVANVLKEEYYDGVISIRNSAFVLMIGIGIL